MIINKVAFFGYARSKETDDEYIAAYETAKLIAKTGRTIVNGGGPGVMHAATQGAKDVGGKSLVVYYQPKLATQFEGKAAENIATEEREASNYIERTRQLLEEADAYIIFNGGTGTVSEFAMAWAVAQLYFGHSKPLIFFGAFWKNILDAFWLNMRVHEEAYRVFKYAVTPQGALEALEEYEKMFERYEKMTPEECIGDECELFLGLHNKKTTNEQK